MQVFVQLIKEFDQKNSLFKGDLFEVRNNINLSKFSVSSKTAAKNPTLLSLSPCKSENV